jgi:AraC-like DNA-binding protein
MFTALVLVYVLVRAVLRGEVSRMIRLVIALCALQSVLMSLRQYYGVEWAGSIQPVTAAAIPALCYIGFKSLTIRPFDWPGDAIHAAAPAFTLFCLVFAPVTLDVVVPTLFFGYGAAILFELRHGPDALPLVRLENGGLPVRMWRLLAAFLIASALSDILIALDLSFGTGRLTPWIFAVFSSATLLGLGLVSLSRAGDAAGDAAPEDAPAMAAEPADYEIVERLKELMEKRELYRNPDLTLRQMARALTLPAKTVSAAVNRAEQKNVSQFVNDYRVKAACRLLEQDGETVTGAMFAAGFQTKSNFNREFRRVVGASPTEWLKGRI